MRALSVLVCLIVFFVSKAQVELLCRINQYMNSTMGSTRLLFTENQIFFLNTHWDNRIRLVNSQNQDLTILTNVPNINNSLRSFSANNAIYYTTNLTNPSRISLIKINDNLSHEILFELNAPAGLNTHLWSGFAGKINGKYVFHMRSAEANGIYELNPINNEIVPLIQHNTDAMFSVLNVRDGYLFYNLTQNNTSEFYFFDGNASHLISSGTTGNNTSTQIIGSTNHDFFVSSKFGNSSFQYYKINKQTSNIQLLFQCPAGFNEVIEHNGQLYGSFLEGNPFRKIEISGDSVSWTHVVEMKSDFLTEADAEVHSNRIRPTLSFKNMNLFAASTKTYGREFFYIDEDDSLSLLFDFNPGPFASFPFLWCNTSFPTTDPLTFSFNGIDYAALTNGNDPFMYLYEVKPDGFTSKFRIHDFKRSIRFYPSSTYLYYFVFDVSLPEVRLYRVRWEDMNDQQPLEADFTNETWSTQITYLRHTSYCDFTAHNMRALDLDINSEDEVIVSLINESLGWLYQNEKRETKNRSIIRTDINHSIYKFDKYGKQLWENSVGELSKFFQNSDRAFFDKEGNVQIFGIFWKKGYFDGDSLETPGSARYYAKLDGQTGQVLHKKVLFETNYIDDTEFLGYALGEDNSIYLAGKYVHFSENFGDTTLVSNTNFQNVLAKYDYNGNLIWIRNMHNHWSEIVGEIRSINFDEVNNEINVYCTQNYNWNCQQVPWAGEVITYNNDGSEIRRKQINGMYKHEGGTLVAVGQNSTFLAGSFQGRFEAGVYEEHTQKQGDCFEPAAYLLQLDKSQNRFIEALYATSNAVNFEHSVKDNDFFYLVGRNRLNGKLTLVRFDHQGTYRGEKELNQKPSTYRIALSNGYFVLSMVRANEEDFLDLHMSQYGFGVSNSNSENTVLSVTRFTIDDWTYSSTYLPMGVKFVNENLGIWAYPNPGFDKIQFNFQDDGKQYNSYNIYDISGRFISSGSVPNQNFMILDVSALNPGLYHMVFSGDEVRNTIRIMKQH